MSSGEDSGSGSGSVDAILRGVAARPSDFPLILIDGPSGAGKTTIAAAVAAAWRGARPPAVIHLDDIYPGWSGLAAASEALDTELVRPYRQGRAGRWRRYDWQRRQLAEWHLLPAGVPLIVEGCGSITRATARRADLSVWLDAADDVRKSRALLRDKGAFDAHWDLWQAQFDAHVTRNDPRRLADLILNMTPDSSR